MYTIRRSSDLSDLELGRVSLSPWFCNYAPETLFKLGWCDKGILVWMRCYEVNPVADVTVRNGDVCDDSCMEFFISPSADNSAGYFNFETNSNPTLLLHYGLTPKFEERVCVEWPIEDLNLTVTKKFDDFGRRYWQVSYIVPFALMAKYIPGFTGLKSGDIIRANLYKCGCTRQIEHYMCAYPIDTAVMPSPAFHVPEFFAPMMLE